jgi:hypothetical protein
MDVAPKLLEKRQESRNLAAISCYVRIIAEHSDLMIRPVQVAMTPELPDDIEIGYSSWRFLPPIGFALAMMFLSTAFALDWVVGGHDFVRRMVGYAGVACFGLVTAKFVWALPKVRAPVLSVNRYGIRDLRIANEFILWESVADVSACRLGRQSFVAFKLKPAVERRLFCVDTARALLTANRALGIDGVAISRAGLAMDFDNLLKTCSAYFAAASHSAAPAQHGCVASSRWTPGYA